jgi:putative DNA primase/helicase
MNQKNEKKPYHETVAENLIKQLEAGTAPWQRPWEAGASGSFLPYNPTTGNRYKGINALHLMSQNRKDQRWLTYKQATEAGGQVRKGEKGTGIQYWKFTEEQIKKDDNGKSVLDDDGKPLKVIVRLERPRVFFATVFNAEQIDGLPLIQKKEQHWNPIERAESMLAASGANIHNNGGDRAFYRPSTDSIHLPNKGLFSSADRYYSTALHELGHWTGHSSRLDRDLVHPFGSEGYAKEELRAEIASMILGDELGIGHDPGQHAAYVESWIKALKDDPLEIFRAAADAEKIQNYVLVFEQVQEQDQQQTTDPELAVEYSNQTQAQDISMESSQHNANESEQQTQRGDQDQQKSERQYINVPYREKGEAKALGARWDRQEQSWYIPPGIETAPFAKWAQDANQEAVEKKSVEAQNQGQRTYLAVPYGERVAAKAAGAMWDKVAKSWYAGPDADMAKLERWRPDNTQDQQGPSMTPKEEFAEALRSLGCIVTDEHPIMDGKKHRIGVEGDKKGEEAGFYVGHLDGHPAGYIKNNRTGIDMKWKSKGYTLDPQEKAKLQAEAATKLAERAAEQERLHEATAQRVSRQMETLVPVDKPTPYLQDKGIQAYAGVLTDKEGQTTYIPAFDVDGKQWTMQYIQEDGTKRFAKDSRKEGCFHPIGGMNALSAVPVLVIAEGYATAASLSEALGQATVAAFDSGNLPTVARALHEKFPDKPIIIAGDDDRRLEATQGINPGRMKAEEAAKAVGGKVIFPIFAPREQEDNPKGFTDFNDLATKSELGKTGVERQVGAAMKKAQAEPDENRLCEQSQKIDQVRRQEQRQKRAAWLG